MSSTLLAAAIRDVRDNNFILVTISNYANQAIREEELVREEEPVTVQAAMRALLVNVTIAYFFPSFLLIMARAERGVLSGSTNLGAAGSRENIVPAFLQPFSSYRVKSAECTGTYFDSRKWTQARARARMCVRSLS